MIKQPQLKRHLYSESIGNEQVLLIGEGRYFALHGKAYIRIIPLLDGKHTTDQIVDKLEDEFSQTEIYRTLLILEKNGHIEESSTALPDEIVAFWNTFGQDGETVAQLLAMTTVSVTPFGNVPLDNFLGLLASLNIHLAPMAEAQFWVALVDDYLQEGLEDFNRQALQAGKTWLIAKPKGIFSWVGPVFQPGHTACWACLAQRIRANYEVEDFARSVSGRSTPYGALAALPATVS